jgi:hypothetical protein
LNGSGTIKDKKENDINPPISSATEKFSTMQIGSSSGTMQSGTKLVLL